MLEQGHSQAEVARRVGAAPNSVWRWWKAYREGGRSALRARPAPGRRPNLSAEQKEDLSRRLVQGARANGFATDLWTCPRIVQLIRRCYGASYHVDSLPRFLRALGFSCQRPQKRAFERDEEAVARWVASDWPRLKKKRPD